MNEKMIISQNDRLKYALKTKAFNNSWIITRNLKDS